jgi:hypothetical protein
MGRTKGQTDSRRRPNINDRLKRIILMHASDGVCWLPVKAIIERLQCRHGAAIKTMARLGLVPCDDDLPYGGPT